MINFKYLFIILFISNINYGFCDLKDSLLDISCQTNLDCEQYKLPQHNVTCLDYECICNDLNGMKIECLPNPMVSAVNNIIGGPCPCNQPHSVCEEDKREGGVCLCIDGYITTFDKRRCIKKLLNLGEICEEDTQCIQQEKFSECDIHKKICKCQKNFVPYNGGCISIIELDETCENNEQCQNKTENSICSNRKCACTEGFITNEKHNQCLPNAGYNEICKETIQCKNKLGVGSECYSGLCTCDLKHVLIKEDNMKENYCEKKIEFGDYCREHNQCYQYHLTESHQSMKCFLGECVCRDGYIHKDKECMHNGGIRKLLNNILIIVAAIITIYISLDNKIHKNYEL